MRLELANIVQRLVRALDRRREIAFALLFGSALHREKYRDIDLAVYLSGSVDPPMAAVYAELLSSSLSKKLGIKIDVVVLNTAPLWLVRKALNGKLLVDRDPVLRAALKLAATDNAAVGARPP